MTDVSGILKAAEHGDAQAAGRLLPLVYEELRRLAAQKLALEKPGQTLDATGLVHEAYVRLVGAHAQPWHGRGHFFAAAAEAMRRILVENARRKHRLRHGGDRKRLPLKDAPLADAAGDDRILDVDEALEKLAREEEQAAQVVKLRYFAGLTIKEVAEALGISVRTANRHWAYARAWLRSELMKEP
jgi:RNA polymerase sigma factor (TIGR02999 family)